MRVRINRGCVGLCALLLMAAICCGCAGKGWYAPGGSLEKPSVIMPSISADERIVATAHIDVVSVRGHYPVRAALILQKPSYLRLELLPVIGTPDFFLTATPSEMKIFIPSRGEFYAGKPTARNMARFLPWSISVEDMVMIFSGGYPMLAGDRLSYESCSEDHSLCVNMKSTSGDSQILEFTKEGRLLKLIRKGADGKEVYQAMYEDYAPAGRLAGKITIAMADALTSIAVRYSDVQIEPSKDLSVFDLFVPPGSQIIQLQ